MSRASSNSFLDRLAALPFPSEATANPLIDLRPALQPSLDQEAHLRRLFAQDRRSKELEDPRVGLVDVHAAKSLRVRQRKIDADATYERPKTQALPGGPRRDATTSDKQHVLALPPSLRRAHGEEAFVSKQEFLRNFAIFTEGSFSTFSKDDWQNVLVAGGSILACLTPPPADVRKGGSKRALRKFFHDDKRYVGSDVDLFIYGLTEEKAKEKMIRLAQAISDGIPWDTVCIRTRWVPVVARSPPSILTKCW